MPHSYIHVHVLAYRKIMGFFHMPVKMDCIIVLIYAASLLDVAWALRWDTLTKFSRIN